MPVRKLPVLLSAIVLAGLLTNAGAAPSSRGTGEGVRDCGDGHTLTWSPTVIWPPNHSYKTVTITYKDANADHQLTLAITSASHNETAADGTELNGAGATPVASDAVITNPGGTGKGSVSGTVDVRSERTGGGTGRTYTINFTAKSVSTDSEGNTSEDNDCSGSVTVSIPHDCRAGACKALNNGKGKGGKNT